MQSARHLHQTFRKRRRASSHAFGQGLVKARTRLGQCFDKAWTKEKTTLSAPFLRLAPPQAANGAGGQMPGMKAQFQEIRFTMAIPKDKIF
jgi:hypothetical protein